MVLGVDLHSEREFDAQALRDAGVKFAYLKVSEGATYADPAWASRSRAARAAGINVGGYHFARPDLGHSPQEEAQAFVAFLGAGSFNLVPALDYEESPYRKVWAQEFLAVLRKEFGEEPLLYASTSKISAVGSASSRLWQAEYGPNDGQRHPPSEVSAAFGRVFIHQYSSVARLGGYEGDANEATPQALAALELGSPPPPKPPHWVVSYKTRAAKRITVQTKHPALWAARHGRSFRNGIIHFYPRKG